MVNYPSTVVNTLSREVSDHSSCLISVTTYIPKVKIFMFENYWMLHEDFMQVLNHGWSIPVQLTNKAKKLGAKFKNLRRVLRLWHQQLSNLMAILRNIKVLSFFLDTLEEYRDLSMQEWYFRKIVQDHMINLLEHQRVYWKQRGRIKWATLGDENTKFFHASGTTKHNKNNIMSLKNVEGVIVTRHEEKANII
jgi:hypothetical protein